MSRDGLREKNRGVGPVLVVPAVGEESAVRGIQPAGKVVNPSEVIPKVSKKYGKYRCVFCKYELASKAKVPRCTKCGSRRLEEIEEFTFFEKDKKREVAIMPCKKEKKIEEKQEELKPEPEEEPEEDDLFGDFEGEDGDDDFF